MKRKDVKIYFEKGLEKLVPKRSLAWFWVCELTKLVGGLFFILVASLVLYIVFE